MKNYAFLFAYSPKYTKWHIISIEGNEFMKSILIAGGDMRNVYLANEFKKRGITAYVCGIDQEKLEDNGIFCDDFKLMLAKADLVILPVPATDDGVKIRTPLFDKELFLGDIITYAKKDCLICGGRLNIDFFTENSLKAFDYAQREDFASLNAGPTAEGALEDRT